MSDYDDDIPDYDAAVLDALLNSAMSGIRAKLAAAYDIEAGLADIYARAGLQPGQPGTPTEVHEPAAAGDASARLQEVCDQIDMLAGWLAAVTRSAQSAPFGGAAFVEMARPDLRQLRMGLANRTLAREEAGRMIGAVQQHLDQADHILRSQHASTLEDTIRERASTPAGASGSLTGQVQVLAEMITRLYADAGLDPSLVPAP